MGTSPADAIRQYAASQPAAAAIIGGGGEILRYAALAEILTNLGRSLSAAGIGAGDRVGVVLPDGPDAALIMLALIDMAVCCPVNPADGEAEHDAFLRDVQPSAVIVQRGLSSRARTACAARDVPVIELEPRHSLAHDPFRLSSVSALSRRRPAQGSESLLLRTSGTTTGAGRLVPLTLANITAAATATCEAYQLGPGDRRLNIMPMFHVQGLVGSLIASLMSGGSVLCAPGFTPAVALDRLSDGEVTWFSGSPTMHLRVLEHGRNRGLAHKLRFVRCGSAALPTTLRAQLEDFYQVPVVESYGMTEAHQIASTSLNGEAGTGLQPTGSRVAILRDDSVISTTPLQRGEILISGPNVISRYADCDPEDDPAFADGWLRTGDEGELRPGGSLVISGRLKELINRGGEKISPHEVEEVLLSHEAVTEAAAYPVPHPELIEEVAAAVVLDRRRRVTGTELQAFSARTLAAHKVPRYLTFLDALPVTGTGKVSRQLLQQSHQAANAVRLHPGADPPRSQIEKRLLDIWTTALGGQRPGVHDDFYQLGGESMAAVTLLTLVRDLLGAEISILTFAEHGSTIADMARLITGGRTNER